MIFMQQIDKVENRKQKKPGVGVGEGRVVHAIMLMLAVTSKLLQAPPSSPLSFVFPLTPLLSTLLLLSPTR